MKRIKLKGALIFKTEQNDMNMDNAAGWLRVLTLGG